MKTILVSILIASTVASAQQTALKPGSEVDLAPLAAATWIQGEAPKSFEPGKVYMFECWATWCGPCIGAIPHINELHKKYHAKGLRVYGMNVWEDGEEKVSKFVKTKGEGMSYPVAYTGKGSAFEKQWLKPAGVRGIPHALIVKDGKIVLTTQPAKLTDSVIESLLSGDEGAEKAVAELNAAKLAIAAIGAFRKAAEQNNVDEMARQIAAMKKADPKSNFLPGMKIDLLSAKRDWTAAATMIAEIPEGQGRSMALSDTAGKICNSKEGSYPAEFIATVSDHYAAMMEPDKKRSSSLNSVVLASIQWKAGKRDDALATAKTAVEMARARNGKRPLPVEPFENFAKSIEDGKLPAFNDFRSSLSEAFRKNRKSATK